MRSECWCLPCNGLGAPPSSAASSRRGEGLGVGALSRFSSLPPPLAPPHKGAGNAPSLLRAQNVTAMEGVNIIIQGVLIGGLYARFAAGLALIFGVMRLVNIAHGDLIVLAAYIALMTTDTLGLNPLLAIMIVVPIMAAIGYGLQRALLNRTLGDDVLPPLLVTF